MADGCSTERSCRQRWEGGIERAMEHQTKPDGIPLRMRLDIVTERGWVDPLPVAHLVRVRGNLRTPVGASNEDVVELVFLQVAPNIGSIREAEDPIERARKAHLFLQPALGRIGKRFARTRVAAAGVGPQAAGMVLVGVPLLEEEAVVSIEHKHRKRAMEPALGVGFELVCRSKRTVVGIDKDDRGGSGHGTKREGGEGWRHSLYVRCRTALPWSATQTPRFWRIRPSITALFHACGSCYLPVGVLWLRSIQANNNRRRLEKAKRRRYAGWMMSQECYIIPRHLGMPFSSRRVHD